MRVKVLLSNRLFIREFLATLETEGDRSNAEGAPQADQSRYGAPHKKGNILLVEGIQRIAAIIHEEHAAVRVERHAEQGAISRRRSASIVEQSSSHLLASRSDLRHEAVVSVHHENVPVRRNSEAQGQIQNFVTMQQRT